MSDQHLTAKIIIHLNHNPGVYTSKLLAEAVGCSQGTASKALAMYQGLNPRHCSRINTQTYVIKGIEVPEEVKDDPPALFDEARSAGMVRKTRPPLSPWREIDPDDLWTDDEIYPPFKIRIERRAFLDAKGRQWYQAKDEHGKWLVFRWEDDQ